MGWFQRWLRERIITIVTSYIQIGGHCGCCGAWCPDELVDNRHGWTLCKQCIREGEMFAQEQKRKETK